MAPGETVYAALFARLQSKVTLCKTFGRKWVEAETVSIEQQPMLLCLEGDETPRTNVNVPSVWELEAVIVVFARTNDVATPGTVLSNILDQIKSALEPQTSEGGFALLAHTHLGLRGTVERAFISGKVSKEDGSLSGGQGWLSIPVHIVATP